VCSKHFTLLPGAQLAAVQGNSVNMYCSRAKRKLCTLSAGFAYAGMWLLLAGAQGNGVNTV